MQAGETSVEIKLWNDLHASDMGQQLLRRIRLFKAVPWGTMKQPAMPGGNKKSL